MQTPNKFQNYIFQCEGQLINTFNDAVRILGCQKGYFSTYVDRALAKNKQSFKIKGKIVQIIELQKNTQFIALNSKP